MEIRYYGDKITHHIAKTPEGFLICQDVPISRTGYQTYLSSEMFDNPSNGHRAIPVYRPASEVFDVKSLASFEGKPVTNEHPDEDVTPENFHKYSCGHVQNVHVGTGEDSNKVLADLYITDPHLIHLIQNGKREISCGYYAEERRDETGRICQTRIRGNHVAVVKSGRAGKNVCIRDRNPFARSHKDYGVKGMKKGVRKAKEIISNAGKRVANAVNKEVNEFNNSPEGKIANAALGLKSKAKRAKYTLTKTPFGVGGVSKTASLVKNKGGKAVSSLAGIAKNTANKARNSLAGKLAVGAGKAVGRKVGKLFGKTDSRSAMKRLDYGVKGMKKGVHKAIEKISNSRVGQAASKVANSKAGKVAKAVGKGVGKAAAGAAKFGARHNLMSPLNKRNQKILGAWGKGLKRAAKRGTFGVAGMVAARGGEALYKRHQAKKAAQTSDSWRYNKHYMGDSMRRRRYLYDEEPFIDDDVMLDEEYLADDDYMMDDDEFIGDDDEFVDDDELMEDEDEFVDDDELMEDDDEFIDDDELMEDEDEFVDDDELMEDDDFEDDDEFVDDDELMEDDDFEDDDEFIDDDDEFMEDDDDEIVSDDDEVVAEIKDVCRDARRTYRMARQNLRDSRRAMQKALRDAIILNDDDIEDDDEEGLIQSDSDLCDDDYLADDDEFMDDDEFVDDDEMLDDDDEEFADDDEEFTDDDEEMLGDDDEEFADDDIEVAEVNDEADVIDEDKTRALREITEASRGISDPNERKHLQDAIYSALCKKSQMPGLVNATRNNVRNRMDSASGKKLSVENQQSIYDSFNPHKKTQF